MWEVKGQTTRVVSVVIWYLDRSWSCSQLSPQTTHRYQWRGVEGSGEEKEVEEKEVEVVMVTSMMGTCSASLVLKVSDWVDWLPYSIG